MPGERRLYKTRKGKAVAHSLWLCSHPPDASVVRWHSGREKPKPESNHMTKVIRLKLAIWMLRSARRLSDRAQCIIRAYEEERGQ